MAKNITIKKKGVSTDFADVERIKTHDKNDEETLWMPEDETTLTDLFVTDNGTYVAEDDGYYGYRQVEVQASGSLIGRSTDDNNEYYVYEDGNGNLVYEPLPSSIVIDTDPTKMEYEDGELIDLTGAVIKAYKGDGTLWTHEDYPDGIIPLNEVSFAPLYADITESKVTASSNLQLVSENSFDKVFVHGANVTRSIIKDGTTPICTRTSYEDCDASAFIGYVAQHPSMPDYIASGLACVSASYEPRSWTNGYTVDGKTVYYAYTTASRNDKKPVTNTIPEDVNVRGYGEIIYYGNIAWTLLYGDIHNGQEIEVKWNRVIDNKQLSNFMYVEVHEQE